MAVGAGLGFFGEGQFEADAEALGFFQLDVAADLVHAAHDVFEAVAEAVGGPFACAGTVWSIMAGSADRGQDRSWGLLANGVGEAAAVVGDGDMQIGFLDVDVDPGIVGAGVFEDIVQRFFDTEK